MIEQDLGSKSFIILGPGSGKNVQCVLEHLLSIPNYSFSLICRFFALKKSAFPDLDTIEYGKENKSTERIGLIKKLISLPKAEIFYVMGTGNLFELLSVVLFSKRNYLVLGIWSDNLPNMLKGRWLKKRIYKAVFKAFYLIQCNWYSTADLLKKLAPDLASRIYIQGFGIDADLYEKPDTCGEFMSDLLGRIPQGKIVYLNSRSIDDYNELLVSLEGIVLLRTQDHSVFSRILHIIWHGNNISAKLLSKLKNRIVELDISDSVWCVEHPFLPDTDMAHLLRRSNAIVNFVNRDQFSMSLVEAMLLKKPMICTDIPAYRKINELLGTQLRLIGIDAESYAAEAVALFAEIDNRIQNPIYEIRRGIMLERFTKAAATRLLGDMFGSLSHTD